LLIPESTSSLEPYVACFCFRAFRCLGCTSQAMPMLSP
jgi:hypothetical protein